jgi:hypothetical protein
MPGLFIPPERGVCVCVCAPQAGETIPLRLVENLLKLKKCKFSAHPWPSGLCFSLWMTPIHCHGACTTVMEDCHFLMSHSCLLEGV